MREQQIIDLLSAHPSGLTVAEAAALTGHLPSTIESRLSKMFVYGRISRRRDPAQKNSPLVYLREQRKSKWHGAGAR